MQEVDKRSTKQDTIQWEARNRKSIAWKDQGADLVRRKKVSCVVVLEFHKADIDLMSLKQRGRKVKSLLSDIHLLKTLWIDLDSGSK